MTILRVSEAAGVLRCTEDDVEMLALLPLVDAYIRSATGHDWATDMTIDPRAKAAARMLLVMWHENPGMAANGTAALGFGLGAVLTQLEALAQEFYIIEGLSTAGYVAMAEAHEGDTIDSVLGLVGTTGDQSAQFETVVSLEGYVRQTGSGLADKWFRVRLRRPGAL
ncbi:MAG: hypothetical protein ACYC6L_02620 [Anaerolineae bacterium]